MPSNASDDPNDQQQCPVHRLHPLVIEMAEGLGDFGARQRRELVHHDLRERAQAIGGIGHDGDPKRRIARRAGQWA